MGSVVGQPASLLINRACIASSVKLKRDCIVLDDALKPQGCETSNQSSCRDGVGTERRSQDASPGGGASTVVHPKETSDRLTLPDTYRTLFDDLDNPEMEATAQVYSLLDARMRAFNPGSVNFPSGKKSSAFAWCRTSSWFIVNEQTREVRVATRTCKLRWCPMCARARMQFLTSQVTDWFECVRNPKFLTLTMQHNEEPIAEQVQYLYDCFKNFRKRKLIKDRIAGGVWFFQIHKSKRDGLWHPHLHCVIDSDFIPHKRIAALWKECTLTSDIIDISAIKDPAKVARDVARYAARPGILADLEGEDRIDLVDAMHGKRLVGKWGNASGISLRPSPPDDTDDWKTVGGWSLVRGFMYESDAIKALVNAWRKGQPLPDDFPLAEVINFEYKLPWKKKSLEHETKQLLLFNPWGRSPPINGGLHERAS